MAETVGVTGSYSGRSNEIIRENTIKVANVLKDMGRTVYFMSNPIAIFNDKMIRGRSRIIDSIHKNSNDDPLMDATDLYYTARTIDSCDSEGILFLLEVVNINGKEKLSYKLIYGFLED